MRPTDGATSELATIVKPENMDSKKLVIACWVWKAVKEVDKNWTEYFFFVCQVKIIYYAYLVTD